MRVEFKDYYRVLGVTPQATSDEIKKAFRALARQYHPDVAIDKKAAEEKFKEINEANEVLSNPESRRKFDQLGADWKSGGASRSSQQPGGPGRRFTGRGATDAADEFQFQGTGFSDFFEQFFGGGTGRFRGESPLYSQEFGDSRAQPEAIQRGHDIQGDILITLDEVLKGAMRAVSVRRTNAHTGREETANHQVRIPKGVLAGQSIRVAGKGGEGANGGRPGDIYLRVHYAEHPDWQVRGSDLIGVLALAPWEAVLGATVRVPTLEGSIAVKVPPGFQQGQKLRVRGKGLPVGGANFGDLYLESSIQVPVSSGQEEQRLWNELAGASPFKPRGGK